MLCGYDVLWRRLNDLAGPTAGLAPALRSQPLGKADEILGRAQAVVKLRIRCGRSLRVCLRIWLLKQPRTDFLRERTSATRSYSTACARPKDLVSASEGLATRH
jgi:hypothetical protein